MRIRGISVYLSIRQIGQKHERVLFVKGNRLIGRYTISSCGLITKYGISFTPEASNES